MALGGLSIAELSRMSAPLSPAKSRPAQLEAVAEYAMSQLPVREHEYFALMDEMADMATRAHRKLQKSRDKHVRRKDYVAPVFPSNVAVFQPVESLALTEEAQLEVNYLAMLDTLKFMVANYAVAFAPVTPVQGTVYVISDFNSDPVVMIAPEGRDKAGLRSDVATSRDLVAGVDPENFNEDFFFLMLQRRGWGRLDAVERVDIHDFLRFGKR